MAKLKSNLPMIIFFTVLYVAAYQLQVSVIYPLELEARLGDHAQGEHLLCSSRGDAAGVLLPEAVVYPGRGYWPHHPLHAVLGRRHLPRVA